MMDTRTFIIAARPTQGSRITEYPSDSIEFAHIASAISIALAILESEQGTAALRDLALGYDDQRLGSCMFSKDAEAAYLFVRPFLQLLRLNFPIVVVDDTIHTQDCLGYHERAVWTGPRESFNPRAQGIHLNGSRVRDMTYAAQRPEQIHRFRMFQFLFATTIVHEAGAHLFITYMTNGRVNTPPQITAPGFGTRLVGESGRFYELVLFGGTTEFYRDSQQDDRQAGVPHQIDADERAWRISPVFIDAVCRYEFTFPFIREGGAIDPSAMQSMGRNSDEHTTNPRDLALLSQQRAVRPTLAQFRGHQVNFDQVKQVPFNPATNLSVIVV
ncbi:hypothetical protein I7I48_04664 [Histoplasma ohiense]|nr:hypothetical protein I7I48_04664 [Histoplasma ohiense (nom. inval.)]